MVLLNTDLYPVHKIPSNTPALAQRWATWWNIPFWSQLFTENLENLACFLLRPNFGTCCLSAAVRDSICRKSDETLKVSYRSCSSALQTPFHNFEEKRFGVGEGKDTKPTANSFSLDFERIY